MKKILSLFLCAVIIFTAVACSGKKNPAETGTGVPTGTTAPITESEPSRPIKDVYGMFDEQYDYIYEDIGLVPETFTVGKPIYSLIDEHNAAYDRNDAASLSGRTPTIYYLATSLSLTAADLTTYFTTCFNSGIIDLMPSEEVINALAGGDSAAAMAACIHPAALCKDGKVFTLRMLLEGQGASYGVTDEDIKTTVESARKYYGAALLKSDLLTDSMKAKLSELGFEVVRENVGSICTLHSDEYHTIPAALSDLVDASEFKTWKSQSAKGSGGCNISTDIVSFVKDFSIAKEDFINIYNAALGTLGNYNIDIIYSEDEGAAETYYCEKHPSVTADIEADKAMAKLKEKIASDKEMDDFVTNVHEFSLAEILLMTSRDDTYLASLEEYMDSLVALPEIDLAGIYENSDELTRMIIGRSVYFIDRFVSGRKTFEAPYEAHRSISE